MSEELKNSPVENFDWDAFEKGEVYGDKSHDELVNTYDQSLNTVKDKEVIEGTVIALNKREVVVNIGYKSDGIIPMSEFRYNPDLKIGDKVEVYIENQEDKKDNWFCRTRRLVLLALGTVLTRLLKTTKSSKDISNVARRAV